ncbi:hypothetical protein [Streptomyces pacificus]|uniref:Uncharacterized protein n=1 Tax=Streptomyces pacificus TaxID=2705029 RepID=A0A6A0AUN4_9ACTN|nr:hypothetical protein [Streptomyces pacificus]GFH36632.1 hypothetical protein SCWH03_28630 [Streptomyces pacificus]
MTLADLVDDFDDGTVNTTLWPASYGAIEESGGRGRIPCTTGYAAYWSASAYTLTDSHVQLQVFPPAAGGAVTATVSVLVLSGVSGRDAGFLLDTAGNAVGLYLREGFADPGAVFLTYSATDHAWLRLREDSGTLHWETSPDGADWTIRRTATSPAWVAQTDLSLLIEAHRDSGTDDYAEIDNLNTPTGQEQALTLATETATALPLAGAKRQSLGAAATSAGAQPLVGSKQQTLGAALAEAAALPLARAKRRTVGQAAETWTARPVTSSKQRLLGVAAEVAQGRALTLTNLYPSPAAVLTASSSGPTLGASTSGPALAATSTTGGS